jgi:myo-inositol-1-phosphate synthase
MYDGTHGAGGASGSNGAHASGASTAGDVARPIPLVADGRPPDGRPARRRLGVAIVGLGGAVATTAVAGIALLRAGAVDTTGLPLAGLPADLTAELARYEDLVFGGWDLDPSDLARAAAAHRVLDRDQLEAAREALAAVAPWPAVGSARWCRNIDGDAFRHRVDAPDARAAVDAIRADLREFRRRHALDGVVMLNLASTEARPDVDAPAFATPEGFEAAVDRDDEQLNPAVLYAYAAILEGVPYGNFTPSVAVDVPALAELARRRGVPVAGKDGKTGQTFVKTVIAPALRERALHVDGWYSHNILGNRDGLALRDRDSLSSKLGTKGSVLDGILGYPVEDHVVTIEYYRPRGDNKEAWDTVDLRGFLGQPMQLKLNFLCKDSILARRWPSRSPAPSTSRGGAATAACRNSSACSSSSPARASRARRPSTASPSSSAGCSPGSAATRRPTSQPSRSRCRRVPSARRPTARRSPPRPPTARRRTGPPSHSSPRPRDTRRAAGARGPAADLRHVADPVAPLA